MEIEELKEWLNRNGFEEVDKSREWEKMYGEKIIIES